MRRPGEKPQISDEAKARIEMFHEQLQKLETLWGVELSTVEGCGIVYVDSRREDEWDDKAQYDAWPDQDGKLVFETFDWWGI